MLIITAIKNIRKNLLANLFELIEMIAVIVITMVMISSVLIRYQLYTPFKEYFSSDGLFVDYISTANEYPDSPSMSTTINDETLEENLKNVEDIVACHSVFTTLADHEYDSIYACSYDDKIIENYKPEIIEGRWLDINSDEIEVVIGENNYDYKVGDYVDFKFVNDYEPITLKVKIVGKIKDGSKIPGYILENQDDKVDFSDFYYPYYYDIEGYPLFIFSFSQLDNYQLENKESPEQGIIQSISSKVLIKFSSKLSDEQLEEEINTLSSFGELTYCDMTLLNKNSKLYLYKQVYDLLPLIIVLFLLVLISSISSNALLTKRRLKNYSIYYITGLQWKHCVFINLIQSIIISLVAVMSSFIIILFVKMTNLSENITILINQYTLFSTVFIIILYMIISMLMPTIIIGKNTPKQILTR
jgi:hypothetical protein